MAARLILPTDPIEVRQLCCLIYGQPGARKSSLAQTADEPITLAFDEGIYRAYGRRASALFDSWEDVLSFDLSPYKTIVVDTAGMCLEKLALSIIADNPKHGNRLGGLSLQGYGVLKTQFAQWVQRIRQGGKDLVFTAHETEERNGDETYHCPDLVGSNYNTLMNHCDLVGYSHFESGKRCISWNPTDRWMAKTPPCGWATMPLPDFGKEPKFLARLIAEAKASMGRVSAESAEVASEVDKWRKLLSANGDAFVFNQALADIKTQLREPALSQVKKILWENATHRCGLVFDKVLGAFLQPTANEEEPAPDGEEAAA